MKKERLYHAVANKITQKIDAGEFPVGSRLPGERELAEQFGVSRVTIREAEIALQALGQLQIKTGSGVYVLEAAKNDGLPDVSAFELTQARLLFESEAAALAALDISDDTLEHLEYLTEKMASDDHDESDEADREFHLTIAAASGNAAVRYVVEIMWKIRNNLEPVKAAYDAVCDEDASERGAEHSAIVDALRNRNPAGARKAMRQHFSRLLEAMLDVTEEQALSELRRQATESRRRYLKSV